MSTVTQQRVNEYKKIIKQKYDAMSVAQRDYEKNGRGKMVYIEKLGDARAARAKAENDLFIYEKDQIPRALDMLNLEYVKTIIALRKNNITEIQKIGIIKSPFGTAVDLDFGHYHGS